MTTEAGSSDYAPPAPGPHVPFVQASDAAKQYAAAMGAPPVAEATTAGPPGWGDIPPPGAPNPVSGYQAGGYWLTPEIDLSRPARRQVQDFKAKQLQAPEGCNEYNIWCGSKLRAGVTWSGEHWYDRSERERSETRCVISTDAGRTKGNDRDRAWFCIHFARGCCAMGPQCTYLHRLPTVEDEPKLDHLHDCFGRERHRSDRDDMQGTGNFNRDCRTLYVGGMRCFGVPNPEDTFYKHFSEWGPIEKFRVMGSKGIGFLTYKWRCSAEFAKEAMNNQVLDHDDVVVCKWAYEDPNPGAQEMKENENKERVMQAIAAQGMSLASAEYHYPPEYQLPGGVAADVYGTEAYPDTTGQYEAGPVTEDVEYANAELERIREAENKLAGVLDALPSIPAGEAEPEPAGPPPENVPVEQFGDAGGQAAYDYQAVYEAYCTEHPPDIAAQYAAQYIELQRTNPAAYMGSAYAEAYQRHVENEQKALYGEIGAAAPDAGATETTDDAGDKAADDKAGDKGEEDTTATEETGGDAKKRKGKGKAAPKAKKGKAAAAKETPAKDAADKEAEVAAPAVAKQAEESPVKGRGKGKAAEPAVQPEQAEESPAKGRGKAAAKGKKDKADEDKVDATEAEVPKGKKGKATTAAKTTAREAAEEGEGDATGKRKTRSRAEPKAAEKPAEKAAAPKRTRRR